MAQFLAQRWRRQPQGPVAVDWGNPLARGLVAAWSGATPDINLVTRAPVTVSGTRTIEVGPRGRALRSTAGSTAYVQLLSDAETPTSQYAITALYRKTDATNRVSTAFGDSANASVHVYLPFSDGTVYFDFGGTSGSRRLTAAGLSFGDDVWTFQAADSGLEIWQNRTLRASNSAGALTANPAAFWLGRAFGANADEAQTTLGLVHARGMTGGEVAQLHENPWQLFRAPRPIIYSLPAATTPVGGVFLRQRWKRQPQGPVAVDWGNPLTRGLKAAFDLRTVRDLVTQTSPSLDTASTVVNQQGVGKTFPGTTTTQFAHRSNYALTGPMTAFVLADINTLSNYTPFISKEQNATTNVAYEFRCGAGSGVGSELVVVEATAAGQIALWNSPMFTVSNGFKGSVAFTRDSGVINGGNRNFFANGKKFSGTLGFSNGSTSIGDDGASAVMFGSRVDAATRLDGRVYLANLWDRALSDSEIAALSENPWQLFRAPKPIVFSLPGGATIPTLSSPTVINITTTGATPRVTLTF